MVPTQVLDDIDNSRNPMNLTKDGLERAATENQFMNGKIAAISVRFGVPGSNLYPSRRQSYQGCLIDALPQSFPELEAYLRNPAAPVFE
jgi:mediator of RNA polymerase II transcription subunit 10